MLNAKEYIKQSCLYIIAQLFSTTSTTISTKKSVYCSKNQVQYYANTPNTIIYYDDGIQKGFFRECRLHEVPNQYLRQLISEYCEFIYVNEHSEECKKILSDKLNSSRCFK